MQSGRGMSAKTRIVASAVAMQPHTARMSRIRSHAIQSTAEHVTVMTRAKGVSRDTGIQENGNDEKNLTIDASTCPNNSANCKRAGAKGRFNAPAMAARSPEAQHIGNTGAHTRFDMGETTGSILNREQAWHCASMAAEIVRENDWLNPEKRFLSTCSKKNSKSVPKSTMPKVASTDRVNEAETAEQGRYAITTKMQRPIALRDDGRRLPNNARMPTEDMNAARIQERASPDITVYAHMIATSMAIESLLGTRKHLSRTDTIPVTRTRWAPDTATRCASPAL